MPKSQKLVKFFTYAFLPTRSFLLWILQKTQFITLRFYKKYENEVIDCLETVYRENDILLQPIEAYMLYQFARMQKEVPGDFAEVGTYRGGSAKILCTAKEKDRIFYGLDTFEGLPAPEENDSDTLKEHQFLVTLKQVQDYLSPFPNVRLIQGLFPASGVPLEGKTFALVHLDVDLYEGIRSGLQFFWNKLSPKGVIIIHDTHFEGVRQAIAEFMAEHQGAVRFQTPGTQTVLLKC